MKVITTSIPEVIVFEPPVFSDDRGHFQQTYQEKQYREAGVPKSFVQDNQSYSIAKVLRGLHFQLAHPQGKLVRVTKGEVFDVAVDLRKNSPPLASGTAKFYLPKIAARCMSLKTLLTASAC
jgi:dTDP-4-dehydrorhamnose 3,5-epimerase